MPECMALPWNAGLEGLSSQADAMAWAQQQQQLDGGGYMLQRPGEQHAPNQASRLGILAHAQQQQQQPPPPLFGGDPVGVANSGANASQLKRSSSADSLPAASSLPPPADEVGLTPCVQALLCAGCTVGH